MTLDDVTTFAEGTTNVEPAVEPDVSDLAPQTTRDDKGAPRVPLEAVVAARRHAAELKRENEGLKAQAAKSGEIEAALRDVQPYVEFLKAHPDVVTRATEPTPSVPAVDPQTTRLARDLELYTSDGQPDVKRAEAVLGVIERVATAKAQATVAPVAETAHQQQSQLLYQRALVTKDREGRTVDPQTLSEMWAMVPAEASASPEVARILWLAAAGRERLQPAGSPPSRPGAPVERERAGGRDAGATSLSEFEQRILTARGISRKDYDAQTKDWTPGEPVILEE